MSSTSQDRTTYTLTREPRGTPHGTFHPEHLITGVAVLVATALHDHGAAFAVGDVHRLAIGQNVTALSSDYRYSVERDQDHTPEQAFFALEVEPLPARTLAARRGAYVCPSCGTDEAMPGHEC